MRALCFEWPDDPSVWDHPFEYLLGDDLLVAPVVVPGATAWEVYLPSGEWIDAWRGGRVAGPARVHTPVPIDEIPVFVRASVPVELREVFRIGREP